eukprot:6928139-Pyramimonas_sp.AAC.2
MEIKRSFRRSPTIKCRNAGHKCTDIFLSGPTPCTTSSKLPLLPLAGHLQRKVIDFPSLLRQQIFAAAWHSEQRLIVLTRPKWFASKMPRAPAQS